MIRSATLRVSEHCRVYEFLNLTTEDETWGFGFDAAGRDDLTSSSWPASTPSTSSSSNTSTTRRSIRLDTASLTEVAPMAPREALASLVDHRGQAVTPLCLGSRPGPTKGCDTMPDLSPEHWPSSLGSLCSSGGRSISCWEATGPGELRGLLGLPPHSAGSVSGLRRLLLLHDDRLEQQDPGDDRRDLHAGDVVYRDGAVLTLGAVAGAVRQTRRREVATPTQAISGVTSPDQ